VQSPFTAARGLILSGLSLRSPIRTLLSRTLSAVRLLPKIPLIIVLIAAGAAAFADPINGRLVPDYKAIDLAAAYTPPWPFEGSSLSSPLGTDGLGRDILSRMITGARISLSIAFTALFVAGTVGTLMGLFAGYVGRWLDAAIMRVVDVMLSFPQILVALLFASLFRPNFWMLVVILGLVSWPHFARLVRGEVLSVKERDYVALARVAGASPLRIIFTHILGNVRSVILVLATLQIGWLILVEAGLSFLGAGIPPPSPTWGSMVSEGSQVMQPYWWIAVFPGGAIALVVFGFNALGDWLRDYYDPQLRQLGHKSDLSPQM
jgi:peptide/nickel transport system permease protein